MKALLINPHKLVPISFSLTQGASPPLGLAYIAAALETQGYEITVLDCVAEAPGNYFPFEAFPDTAALGIGFNEMFGKLGSHYDLVGVSVMFSNNWLINRHLIDLLKERYPAALVVAGGEHASAICQYCLQDCKGLDMVVAGEGEETISEIAARQKEGRSLAGIEGTVYKARERGNEIVTAPRRKRIREVNDVDRPAWHLFPLAKYFDHGISYGIAYGRSLPILATRGCPYQCTFCSSPLMWGTRYSMRDAGDVVDEIKMLNATFGVTNFDFFDLTAIVKKQWILDFCAGIKGEALEITWQIPAGTRSEAIDYEVAVALKDSGCRNISYAPESGSVAMLKAIKKMVKLPRMLQSIRHSHRAGLNVKLNIILGYPDEKMSDMLKTAWFLAKASYCGATDAVPSMFSPYPGSALFDELEKNGELVLSDDYFKSIVFSQSLHRVRNYNRNNSKAVMVTALFLSICVFYAANYLCRPMRAFRLFLNLVTRNYQTRGEYMLATMFGRRKAAKKSAAVAVN